MNQKTKLIIFSVGGLLLFLVTVFGVFIAQYEPHMEQEFPGLNVQTTLPEIAPEQAHKTILNESPQKRAEKDNKQSPSSISVKVLDEQHNTIFGAVCDVWYRFYKDDGYTNDRHERATTTNDGACHLVLLNQVDTNEVVKITIGNKKPKVTLIDRHSTEDELMLTVVAEDILDKTYSQNQNSIYTSRHVLAVKVVDEEGRPVLDSLCTLRYTVIDEWEIHFAHETQKVDTQGVCYLPMYSSTVSATSVLLNKKSSTTRYISKGLDVESIELVLNRDVSVKTVSTSSPANSSVQIDNPTQKACSDSDGGQDYFEQGMANGIARCIVGGKATDCPGGIVPRTDVCTAGSPQTNGSTAYVYEYFCGEDGRIASELGPCQNGCLDGACKK